MAAGPCGEIGMNVTPHVVTVTSVAGEYVTARCRVGEMDVCVREQQVRKVHVLYNVALVSI